MDNQKNDWNIENDDLDPKPLTPEVTDSKKEENPINIQTGHLVGPVVLFVGPQSAGKTTALIRTCRYLINKKSFDIDANRQWSHSSSYNATCDWFMTALQDPQLAPTGNNLVDFLCIDAIKSGKQFCQFIEAPGEAYYDPKTPRSIDFPPYLQKILNTTTINKTLVLTFFNGMLSGDNPKAYSDRLGNLLRQLNPKYDDIIILYNRVDENRNLGVIGKKLDSAVKKLLKTDPDFTSFFNIVDQMKFQLQFVAFSSGNFQEKTGSEQKHQIWVESKEEYPESLSKAISFSVTPSFFNKTKRLS